MSASERLPLFYQIDELFKSSLCAQQLQMSVIHETSVASASNLPSHAPWFLILRCPSKQTPTWQHSKQHNSQLQTFRYTSPPSLHISAPILELMKLCYNLYSVLYFSKAFSCLKKSCYLYVVLH